MRSTDNSNEMPREIGTPGCEGEVPTMNIMDLPDSLPVRRAGISLEYVLLADIPQPWRAQCWAYLGQHNARLIVAGAGPAVMLRDWRDWLEALSKEP